LGYSDEVIKYVYYKNNGYCWWCGKKLALTNYGRPGEKGAWEIDHSNPVSRGGNELPEKSGSCVHKL